MQLSPRQYQVDPTGSSYVADTRPLMAAMGAQAASQIEGNRMMQETVQRGMKGVEDFAARRQLAAARVQLGELKLTDPDYGQKLSGLVMDNPLAFTNEKTAGVANFAFKQASDSYLAKEKIKADSLSRYQDYRYALDLAQMRMVGDQSLASKQNARYAADVFRSKSAVLTSNLKNIDDALLTARPEDLPYLQSERAKIQGELGSVNTEYETSLNQSIEPSAVNMREPLGAPPLPGQEVPMDNEVLSPNLSTQQNLDASLFPGVVEGPNTPPFLSEEENLPPLMSAMSPETAAPISPSDIQYSEPMQNLRAPVAPAASAAPVPPMAPTVPVAPAATAQPSASFTPEQIAASRQAFYESQSKKSSSSAQPGKMTQSTIDALVNLNPAVIKAQIEYDELEANIGILGDRIKGAVEFSADTPKLKTELETLLKGLPAAKNKLALIKSSAEVQLSGLENPQEIMDFYKVQEAVAQDRLKRAETEAAAKAAAAGAPAAGAGTTTETPKPPAPPVGSDPLEQVAIDRELKRKAGPEPVSPEINKKWTENKQKIIDVIPPKELMRIADEVYGDSVIGVSLPADKTRLTKLIQVRLSDNQKISGDGKNLGFYQDGKYVSQDDLVAALVDDIIRARQSGTAKANDSAIAPQSRIPLNTNTELIAQ
jgi:hypothetical protein